MCHVSKLLWHWCQVSWYPEEAFQVSVFLVQYSFGGRDEIHALPVNSLPFGSKKALFYLLHVRRVPSLNFGYFIDNGWLPGFSKCVLQLSILGQDTSCTNTLPCTALKTWCSTSKRLHGHPRISAYNTKQCHCLQSPQQFRQSKLKGCSTLKP